MTMSRHELLVVRIRIAYAEMPDLKVTFQEACRMWQADEVSCAAALDILMAEGLLIRTSDGTFVAAAPGKCGASE
jgi:hypothetical protein